MAIPIIKIFYGRNNRINEYFNNAVKLIINECLKNNITTVVIGYNKEQKQDGNMGAINNQNFQCIPYYKFREKLKYKCELYGIKYCPQEESYTSKASCFSEDYIPTYGDSNIPKFKGIRKYRGLYQIDKTHYMNADVNGSINILRKYFQTRKENWVYQDSLRAFVNTPCLRLVASTQAPSLRWG